MLITEFTRALERIVPLEAVGFSSDAVGMQAGLPKNTKLTKALFAYEVTAEVIAEARKRGANFIVAFHPLIFPSITSITDRTRTGALLRSLIKSDIALYVQHTAFDTQPEFGTSRLMAEALGLEEIRTLAPSLQSKLLSLTAPEEGMGAIGRWRKAKSREEVLASVAKVFGTPSIRTNAHGPKLVRQVAMLGGAGMDFYGNARDAGANAFITADVRYHDFYRADHDGLLLIDAGHAETERFVTRGMVRAARAAIEALNLQKEVPASCLIAARFEPNSVRYYHRK
jgi:dinuclear metal center YbgI/SA1388 family protein